MRKSGSVQCGDSWKGWKPKLMHGERLCWGQRAALAAIENLGIVTFPKSQS
ncbi:hypothetical protein [Archangium sp.]|uniref:hypothetical protein n=1 Tax=Archangium sp. TaxID=1872627 RepID=UPI00389B18D8